jgi:D-glycero-beta-D-manno-heptose-7-phosphate kinase
MTFLSLGEIFDSFNNLKVLIIGDVMIDSYIYGKTERISPEAPVPIVHAHKKEKRLGGAANVALNIQALGATPILCSVIGNDAEGHIFCNLLNNENITSEGIIRSEIRITTVKERILSGAQQMLRVDSEMDTPLYEDEEILLVEKIRKLMPECDVVIFEDYDKGTINQNLITQTTSLANTLGIPTVVDPKKRNFLAYHNTTLFKPNLKELKEGLKIDFQNNDKEAIVNAAQQLKQLMNIPNILITLSEKGVFISNHTEHQFIPAHVRQISDVSGAGDTVISIIALCIALKLPSLLTASLSNLGGGLVCEHVGVVPVNKEALFNEAIKHNLFM